MEPLADQVAIVTGAGAGIGREVALQLARDGCNLGLFDINERAMLETADEVRRLGRKAVIAVGNVARRADVVLATQLFANEFDSIDILVNNAGILRTCKFLDLTENDWRECFAVNLDGVFFFCQAILAGMVERRSGNIVNISSWTGKKGVANHAAYGATKAAILNLTQSLAEEFGPFGIRVNAVCPGIIIDTNMRTQAEVLNRAQGLPDVASRAKSLPLGRPGYPREIAEVVAFLASARAGYMTGQAVNVTGGLWMN